MAVVARISAIWSKQKLFVAIFFLALSVFFYVDGFFRYPKSNVRWNAYERFTTAGPMTEWPAEALQNGWVEEKYRSKKPAESWTWADAESSHWVSEKPHKFYDTGDLVGQYVMGGVATITGLLLYIYWLTQRKRQLKIEDGVVYTPTGARVPFASIRGLGKKRWDSKGIAIVRYEDKGRLLQFIVDDYKYETEPTRLILDTIEQQLTAKNDHAA